MKPILWNLTGVSLGTRLRDITLQVPPGVTAVLGQSGAGKTSLLNLLVEFERAGEGEVEASLERGPHARPLFWVPQDDGLWPHLTAREHLTAMGPVRADALLAEFDLAERATALPPTLSRGERTRLAVARALAADAAVLVMDEPLAHVDPGRIGRYWAAIRRHLSESGASLVFATHAPGIVLAEARWVVCLKGGRLLHAGGVAELYESPPSAELAACLGEANWLEPGELRLWLGQDAVAARCLRPERIAIAPAADGNLVLESARFYGAVAEAQVRHVPSGELRTFWHRPASDGLRPGVRVALELR
jgi:iron(III) transport system ATP-binding protein